jgi:hypothetical protein
MHVDYLIRISSSVFRFFHYTPIFEPMRRTFKSIVLLAAISLFASCGLFHKKCDCPNFSNRPVKEHKG